MWSYSENIWPNARAFDEFRTHLVTVGRIDQMRRLVKCALHIASLQIIATCSVLVSSRLYKKDIPVLRLVNVTNIAGSEPGVSWCPDIPRFDQGVSRDNPSFNKLSVIFIEPLLICEWLIVDFVPPKA